MEQWASQNATGLAIMLVYFLLYGAVILAGFVLLIRNFRKAEFYIAPEELPRVKDRFYKGKSSRRGSGIGLAVADEIINMHGGSLKLTSRKGEGTTVTITLPLARG